MRRYLIYISTVATALLMWGCSEMDLIEDGSSNNSDPDKPAKPGKPTVPIKRRPIVPTTKLPRPRIIERVEWTRGGALSVQLAESVSAAEVIIRDMLTAEEVGYLFEGDRIEIAVPDTGFELVLRIGDECYVYSVEEE
ncbi:MAG: hypothetical protein J6J64_00115 [Alistipes sp.]|nr:hypothetical protein [Alistipes sp.]